MIKVSNLNLDYILSDDDHTETGGISQIGETLLDFLEETNMLDDVPSLNFSLAKLNQTLSKCGIQELNPQKATIRPSDKQHQISEWYQALSNRAMPISSKLPRKLLRRAIANRNIRRRLHKYLIA